MTTTTNPTVAERVNAGATWLDQREPGWADRIDLDQLDLGSDCRCILGQLHDNYGDGIDALGIHFLSGQTMQFGFNAWNLGGGEFDELTAAWRELISQRRAGPDHGGSQASGAAWIAVLIFAAVLLVLFGNWS
jgi:hypothetical protein